MIKVLILYYLSLKPTHGYEIQKFIQANHMDSWTKIQSGSIYYALAKLEKEGLIRLADTVRVGGKVRKIYAITEMGRAALTRLVSEELNAPICETGSDKFILYPLLGASGKAEIERAITAHIAGLERQIEGTAKWQRIKLNADSLQVERLAFEMMLSSLEYQVKWHRALLAQLDECIKLSSEVAEIIAKYDFSNSEAIESGAVSDMESLKKRTLNI